MLELRAAEAPDRIAYRFLGDGDGAGVTLTYGELAARARSIAETLVRHQASGSPVVVAHPSGLAFLESLFACWYAGAIAVPCYPPQGRRHRERLAAVAGDSGAVHVLGAPAHHEAFLRLGMKRLETETPGTGGALPPLASGLCLLQYTSGSTASPKGVQVSHANLLHQLDSIRRRLGILEIGSMVSWLPPYHDMGLVAKILHAVGSGIPLTFFSPEGFVQQPLRWLRAIHEHRAEFSAAPNFAYELCLRAVKPGDLESLDLSCWKVAPCGAERVRPETLARFAERFAPCGFDPGAFRPGYGLAESTLIVTVGHPEDPLRESGGRISCGVPLDGLELKITDPITRQPVGPGQTGEILVKGASVAGGYWRRPEESAAVFGPDGWLRTGDLGSLENGELFVEGRLKDLLIVDGANHAPEDLEIAATGADPRLVAALGAAFAVGDPERVIFAQEIPHLPASDHPALCHSIRRVIGDVAGVALDRVLLIRQGTLPRTTSGKIRRSACRVAFLEGGLSVLHDDGKTGPCELTDAGRSAFDLLREAVAEVTDRPPPQPGEDPLHHGLSSLDVTRLVAGLRNRGLTLSLGEVFAARSFAELANELAEKSPAALPQEIPVLKDETEWLPSHSQERMWFLHQLDPESAAYHVFGALDLEGSLDGAALERAYRAILIRHEILRSRHGIRDGRPRLSLSPVPVVVMDVEDVADDDAAIQERLGRFSREPFDLARDSPIRALRLELGKSRNVVALCAHHIVADGWSIRLLVGELAARYREECAGPQPLPAPVSPSYPDYATWHRGWIDSGGADKAIAYWRDRLAGHEGALALPLDFPRPARASSAGCVVGGRLPAALLEKVKSLAINRRTTPFVVFLTGFLVLLRQHGGGGDPVIAVPVANRNHSSGGHLIGTLVNTLPFRLPFEGSEHFAELVDRVRDASFEMLEFQDAPFERIIGAVQPERALDRSPLAQVMFDHQEIPLASEWAGGLRCSPQVAHRGAAQFDLSVLLFAFPDHQELHLEYRTDLFREESVNAIFQRYLRLLESAVSEPMGAVGDLHGLTDADEQLLERFSQGPSRPDFIGRIPFLEIQRTVERVPSATALVCGETSWSYADLWQRVEGLAAVLASKGIARGSRVAVMLERDAWLPAVLLAIWRTGACYVPLDAANPAERLGWILEDQTPLSVLVSPSLKAGLPAGTVTIDFDPSMAAGAPEAFEAPPIHVADPAYILYTSGSTGRPKGVAVSHGALGNFLLSMLEEPGMQPGDRLAAITTVSFDISALELYLPLFCGATVDLIPGALAKDGTALMRYFEAHPPTVLQATPATWRMLIAAGWKGFPDLKILCGGEAMDLSLAAQLRERGKEVWNLYGPTETTVWSSLWKVADNDRITVGRPIANTGLRVLDAEGKPVPPGVTGELFIGGAGLAEGYWRQPELTAARFVRIGAERFYRTGDLAKWLPDGSLECLGRSDGQVKVRGFRVELGEVETAMLSHPGVAEAAAVVVSTAGEGRLVGYFKTVGKEFDAADLSRHLSGLLPDYMVPAPLVAVTEMPLTSSGKIDRKALAAIQPEASAKLPPQGVVETEVAAAWSELLGVAPVGRDDDFFALGGHSLLATRMTAALSQRLGFPVALDALFQRPTVAAFAARIRDASPIDLAAPRAILLHSGSSQEPPVFWIHTLVDGGMGLFPYREAAAMVGENITSYGIAEGEAPFDCIQEMARHYVAVIRAVQPTGPYRIAGFCFGGNLAAEIAWQLAAAGETIESLVLMEARPIGVRSDSIAWLKPSGWGHFLNRLRGQLPRMARFDGPKFRQRFSMKVRALIETLGNFRTSGCERTPDIHAVLDLTPLDGPARERAIRHWTALHRHHSRLPETGRLLVVRAADDGWLPRPESLGWCRHAPGGLETEVVPGRHEDFLRGGSAAEVAAVVRRVLA